MSVLPDEIWRQILEIGISSCNFNYKDLCRVGISSRSLKRLSEEDEFWSTLVSQDFPKASSSVTVPKTCLAKSLYRIRFEREKERMMAAHRRAVLRTESLVWDSERKLKELTKKIEDEVERMRAASIELANLRRVRQASAAVNVWQPEMVCRTQKAMVEQCAVPVESRISMLEMEVKLCKQQISAFDKAHKNGKQRLETMKQQLASMKYHPLTEYKDPSNPSIECHPRRKKLKFSIDDGKGEKSSSKGALDQSAQ